MKGQLKKLGGEGALQPALALLAQAKPQSVEHGEAQPRGRRPPALQPRYSTSVRVVFFDKLCGSDCMLVRT